MKNAGCQVFAVDHQANRFTPKVPTFTIDLSLEDEVTVANQMLEFVKPDAVHFGLEPGNTRFPKSCNGRGPQHLDPSVMNPICLGARGCRLPTNSRWTRPTPFTGMH